VTALQAPAKLNLFLHVLGRRDDGYHELQTVFRLIDRADTVRLSPRDDGELRFTGPYGEDNLCLRAAHALKAHSGTRLGADITLEKTLPVGGGLGGGSSDAATTLVGLNRLWKLHLGRAELMRLGVKLGADVPVFGTFQGADYQLSRLERPVRPRSIRASAGLIVGARRELERVRAAYGVPAQKLAHVVNPVDAGLWRPADGAAIRRELDIPESTLVVTWHGQMQLRRKGLDVLLDAWQLLGEARDAHLVLVGAGEDAGEIARRAQGARRVHLVQEWVQDRERMRAILSSADVYVFPSRHEGLPVAPLEAMACGLPVVGADASGVADVVGDTGIVVPREDVDALALGLGELLDDADRRADLGRKARSRLEQSFALEPVGTALRSFLVDRDVA